MIITNELILDRLFEFGIDLNVQIRNTDQGIEITLTPLQFEATNGFKIVTRIAWRTVSTKIVFGTFSLPLLKFLQLSKIDNRILCNAFLKAAVKQGYSVTMEINKLKINFEYGDDWPVNWDNFNLEVASKYFDTSNDNITQEVVLFEQETILGAMVSLLDLESNFKSEENASFYELQKLPEGAKIKVEVNKYERNQKNRVSCINYFGLKCQVCDFDFEKVYGKIGKGFIHVHHLVPLSQLGEKYLIDPINDLIPVCPNCHCMLHKGNPPFSIEELKLLVRNK